VRILLRKLSDDRHVLTIVRDDGLCEEMECETRSYLQHDLLHYATEAEARLEEGFWGNLAKGKTLAQMNDRTGKAMQAEAPQMLLIEQIVGALSGVTKGVSADVVFASFRDSATSAGMVIPAWLTSEFVAAVQERMRRLLGHWKATPYGEVMDLPWPREGGTRL
jgi:hypothetical protein